MKLIFAGLVVLLLLLQYELWFSKGGLLTIHHLQRDITDQTKENQKLKKRNAALLADIKDLKHENEAVEEHARNDLGMVKDNEVFYQIIDGRPKQGG